MGWTDFGDGMLDGDGPADSFAACMRTIAAEARRRACPLPTGETLLAAFVGALSLDGWRAPFYAEQQRIDAIVVHRDGAPVRIVGRDAPAWIVAELYTTLELVADDYQDAWGRPPHLRELMHYLEYPFDESGDEEVPACIADPGSWRLEDARFELRRERKAEDRAEPPVVTRVPNAPRRVRHAKFGEGAVIAESGDRLTVRFADGQRVVLRSFVTSIE